MSSSTEGLIKWQPSQTSLTDENNGSQANVWKQMSYTPPRGPCGFKSSIMTPACACLRFMIHPIKAPTSFECDGCSHHASYHQMHSQIDKEFVSRWMREDGTFDQEAYEMDEEVQEIIARRKSLGFSGEMSSMTSNGGVTMPGKARSTLVEQPSKKRPRSEKMLY